MLEFNDQKICFQILPVPVAQKTENERIYLSEKNN
jgi:hypothetical protein